MARSYAHVQAVESAENATDRAWPMTPAVGVAPWDSISGQRGASRIIRRETMTRYLWICFGSAVGGGIRYLVSGWTQRALGPSFPYGTLAVNLVGSFLLSAFMYGSIEATWISPTMRLALATGVLGGFTTYSTFNYETTKYLHDGAWWLAGANVTITVLGCLVASFLGWIAARWLLGGRL
jgi:CrcB protein